MIAVSTLFKKLILLVFIFSFINPIELLADDVLEFVGMQLKVRDRISGTDYNFETELPKNSYDKLEFVSGDPFLGAFQPTAIIKNVSDKEVTFIIRLMIRDTDKQQIIYNRIIPVSKKCLSLSEENSGDCTGDPNILVRYCEVEESDNGYKYNDLPFPGEDSLEGIAPGGYCRIRLSSVNLNMNSIGNFEMECYIKPESPDTFQDIGETVFDNDTFKINYLARDFNKMELLYPMNEFVSDTNLFDFSWMETIDEKIIEYHFEVSDKEDFSNIIYSKVTGNKRLTEIELAKGIRYYWRVTAKTDIDDYPSQVWTFKIKDKTIDTSIEDDKELSVDIFPNPVKDEFRIISPIKGNLQVVNLIGEVLFKVPVLENSVQIVNLPDLPKGTYFIIIKSASDAITQKFIKI